MLRLGRYLSGPLQRVALQPPAAPARRLAGPGRLATLGALFATGEAFLLDSLPVPACRRARARRSRKLRGQACCGYCAAKREKFFGWRRHLVCTTAGCRWPSTSCPAGCTTCTPLHELTHGLPAGAAVDGDKADNAGDDEATILADTGVRLVPRHTANMRPNDWADKLALRA